MPDASLSWDRLITTPTPITTSATRTDGENPS